jgi:DNA-directed RNA polymerase specialized sigma24 family protein
MSVEQVYDRLRSIGCSVETSDALASIVAELSDKKLEAFFLWACGMTEDEICKSSGISKGGLWRLIRYVRGKCI